MTPSAQKIPAAPPDRIITNASHIQVRLERSAKAEAPRKISRKQLREHKMPETTVPVSLRDAFLEDPFFRTGWDEMNSECKEMRSFTSKEGDNSLSMDRGWPWLPKQWMLPQLQT